MTDSTRPSELGLIFVLSYDRRRWLVCVLIALLSCTTQNRLTTQAFRREEESLWVTISAPATILMSLVPKGYVAVDGTSLTVCEVNNEEGYFTFMLVQHTQNHVIMPLKVIGDEVNLEPDVLGKYAAQAAGRRYDEMSQRLVALEAQLSLLKRCGIIFAASAVAGALFVGATRQKN